LYRNRTQRTNDVEVEVSSIEKGSIDEKSCCDFIDGVADLFYCCCFFDDSNGITLLLLLVLVVFV